jgi:sigma-B regulation protein RsbU (phosphoserine phosphatase)
MFVTVWFAVVTLSTGEVVEVNAGHEKPLLLQKKDGEADAFYEELDRRHGFVLGSYRKTVYKEDSFTMRPGDRLFVYTDGLPEATNAEGERFGMSRVLESVNRYRDAEPEDMLAGVRKDVDEFVKDAEQFDDLTMLCFIYGNTD